MTRTLRDVANPKVRGAALLSCHKTFIIRLRFSLPERRFGHLSITTMEPRFSTCINSTTRDEETEDVEINGTE